MSCLRDVRRFYRPRDSVRENGRRDNSDVRRHVESPRHGGKFGGSGGGGRGCASDIFAAGLHKNRAGKSEAAGDIFSGRI